MSDLKKNAPEGEMSGDRADTKETLGKVLKFIGRYRILLVFSIILAALSVILQLYVPILFGAAIDGIISKGNVDFQLVSYYLIRIAVFVLLSALASYIMAILYAKLGILKDDEGKLSEAESFYRKYLKLCKNLLERGDVPTARYDLASAYERIGSICRDEGRLADAEESFLHFLELSSQLAEETSSLADRDSVACAYLKMGDLREIEGRLPEAEEFYKKGMRISLIQPAQGLLIIKFLLLLFRDILAETEDIQQTSVFIRHAFHNHPFPLLSLLARHLETEFTFRAFRSFIHRPVGGTESFSVLRIDIREDGFCHIFYDRRHMAYAAVMLLFLPWALIIVPKDLQMRPFSPVQMPFCSPPEIRFPFSDVFRYRQRSQDGICRSPQPAESLRFPPYRYT